MLIEDPETQSRRRILIADDEPAIRDILVECVTGFKHGQAYKRHRLISKSKRTRKELKGNLSESETRRVERWMPYGK